MNRADTVRESLADIRAKAAEFRETFGDEVRARLLEWAADRVERAIESSARECLSLKEASARSGYSEEHLARLVRAGRIPDSRPPGSRGRLFIRASDLPTRPGKRHTRRADVHELASRLYGGREGPHGHP